MQPTDDLRYKIFDSLIAQNVRFAVYQLPQNETLFFVLQESNRAFCYKHLSELNEKSGFVISPFQVSDKHPIVLVQFEKVLEGENSIFEYLRENFSIDNNTEVCGELTSTDEGELDIFPKYEAVFDKFHATVESNTLQKLVLSRTLNVDNTSSIGLAFKRACQKYTDNFVYLCNTPESGAWMGASPEIILSGNTTHWKTVALAGTQKVATEAIEILWDEKNIYEQGIVMRYMETQLEKIGVTSVNDTPQTIFSGDLAHLKSEFVFQLKDNSKVGNVLDSLHPTPAVCGYPKDESVNFILHNEEYDRAYYSGFMGMLNPSGTTDLYVNLRCAKITVNSLRLYAGGGIMPESRAKSEWQETEYKLQTILSIL